MSDPVDPDPVSFDCGCTVTFRAENRQASYNPCSFDCPRVQTFLAQAKIIGRDVTYRSR